MIRLWLALILDAIIVIDFYVMMFRVDRKESEENGRMDSEIL